MPLKKSSTFNIGEENASFKINILNENNNTKNPSVKKSKTYIEENVYRLNVQHIFNNLGHNRLGTVLETINEVSNSKIDSSEISDRSDLDEENKNKEKNEYNNKNKNIHEANNSDNKKNDSEGNMATKNTIHLNV